MRYGDFQAGFVWQQVEFRNAISMSYAFLLRLREDGRYFFTNGQILTIISFRSIIYPVSIVIKVFEPFNELSSWNI